MTKYAAQFFLLLGLLMTSPALAAESSVTDQPWGLTATADYSSDSDTIVFDKESLQPEYKASDNLSLQAQLSNLNMEADSASGLAAVNGEEDISMQGFLLGLKQHYNDEIVFEVLGGFEQSSVETNTPSFIMKADWEPADTLRGAFTLSREMYAVSPKAISLEVVETEAALQATWQLTKQFAVDGSAAYTDFSDDNAKRSVLFAPRYRALQTTTASIDAGLRYQWYGFDERSNSGYYSPESYQAYNAMLLYYQEMGTHYVLVSLAPGMYKDQNQDRFLFAGDAGADAVFQLNKEWDFSMHARLLRSGGITSSAYEQKLAGIALKHRF